MWRLRGLFRMVILFVSCSTVAALHSSADAVAGTSSAPFGFRDLGNGQAVFFAYHADGDEAVAQPWRTDGTAAGTVRLDACGGDCGYLARVVAVADGRAYFVARHAPFAGPELYRTDGSQGGTVQLTDFGYGERFGRLDAGLAYWLPGRKRLLFPLDDDGSGAELWSTDGTRAATLLVHRWPAGGRLNAGRGTRVGDRLYLWWEPLAGGPDELWVSDGTTAGTRQGARHLDARRIDGDARVAGNPLRLDRRVGMRGPGPLRGRPRHLAPAIRPHRLLGRAADVDGGGGWRVLLERQLAGRPALPHRRHASRHAAGDPVRGRPSVPGHLQSARRRRPLRLPRRRRGPRRRGLGAPGGRERQPAALRHLPRELHPGRRAAGRGERRGGLQLHLVGGPGRQGPPLRRRRRRSTADRRRLPPVLPGAAGAPRRPALLRRRQRLVRAGALGCRPRHPDRPPLDPLRRAVRLRLRAETGGASATSCSSRPTTASTAASRGAATAPPPARG